MRIHKLIVEIEGSDQALRQVMRIPVPDTVQIESIQPNKQPTFLGSTKNFMVQKRISQQI
jgi:hypothetical protein